tara:strand:- start:11239 stop:11706 length:468 start_codon:yes stop_codon:yes gene_type:complete
MFESLKERTANLMSNTTLLIILAVTFIFIILALYIYNNYVTPNASATFVPNEEFVEKDESNGKDAELYMFVVDWCPHSKKALPIWEQLKEEYDGKQINGYTIQFILIDGEQETGLADKFKVDGYPTIKLVKDNEVIEYDAKPSLDTLKQFLNSTL